MKKKYLALIITLAVMSLTAQDVYRLNDSTFVYPCVGDSTGMFNMIGLPLETAWTMSSDFDPTGTNINAVSKWNSDLQRWESSGFHSALGWNTEFQVETGEVYMLSVKNDFDFEVRGDSIEVVYHLIAPSTAYNDIIHPLTRSGITTAADLGDDIDYCSELTKYDNLNQEWESCTRGISFWDGNFATLPGLPMLIYLTGINEMMWPTDKKNVVKNTSNETGIVISNSLGPRIVYFHVQDEFGSELTYDQIESHPFQVWITGRESEVLTNDSPGCGYTMMNGTCAAYANLGNFWTTWDYNEELNIQFAFMTKQLDQNDSFIISQGASPIYRGFEPEIPGSGDPIQIYTSAIEGSLIPEDLELHQNYPNPFNPETVISFSLPKEVQVTLSVFNMNGQLVTELVNEKKSAGYHSINFNASDFNSGIYFYTLETGNAKLSKKMLFVK